ncbi:LLM class flavin-dependent oxidoreductase [Niallia endozanthoxylica]|uniref:LLM class flavin-dependent oxidoreductase n=1 Tax=Niallia endozanthoxylica TaxID=2036016 RepID=A0A5J5GU97_9BACI|nr:LLM class flavin-dependent oxidoreductase [Niallia endozanthoxylica]KAA9011587.1 LLM class flavin-dependent oxidoreductase [Niallia endozanthoxylica]
MNKTLQDIAYSILDLVPITEGSDANTSFKHSADLAQHAENWGYKRYWLAEHHNKPGIASSATSILIGHIAANTSKIRVGSGGIMLPNHAPLVVAEQFGTLETLFPGRIDLGLGRAPGTDQLTAYALRRNVTSDGHDFPEQVAELRAYFSPENMKVNAIPGRGLQIPTWLLGSSGYSAQLAAQLGLPFAFANHFSPENTLPALALYRNNFKPSSILQEPYVMIGTNIIAADTDEEAEKRSTSLLQHHLGLIRNQQVPLQPPVDDMDALCSSYEKSMLQQKLAGSIIGSRETVKTKLEKFVEETQTDEIIINSQIFDHQARLQSYKIVADIIRNA